MIARARVFALQVLRAFASRTGNTRLHGWAYRKLVDDSDEAGS